MAKTFITTGTGAQQTLGATQNEKIPVYDSKADAEADLTNLSVGQLVATESTHEDDVADLKTYIRNQNLLSDLEPFTMSTTNQTMDYDGMMYITPLNGYQTSIYLNDTEVLRAVSSLNAWNIPVLLEFQKGDTVRASAAVSSTYVRYYKLRDYTGR